MMTAYKLSMVACRCSGLVVAVFLVDKINSQMSDLGFETEHSRLEREQLYIVAEALVVLAQ